MAEDEKVMEPELLSKLEAWLASYDLVFLIPSKNGTVGTFSAEILRAGADKMEGRRLLLLSAVMLDAGGGFTGIQIKRKEEEQLLQLYRMYEFADNFSVIAEDNAYGGLSRLVETGVLTMGEAAQALFMR